MKIEHGIVDRTLFGKGQWDDEPDLIEWSDGELHFRIKRMQFGHLYGYIGVERDHPLYGVPYQEVSYEIPVHCGLTYSDHSRCTICHRDRPKIHWIGFDCAHYNDFSPGLSFNWKVEISSTYKSISYVKGKLSDAAAWIHENYPEGNIKPVDICDLFANCGSLLDLKINNTSFESLEHGASIMEELELEMGSIES